MDWYYILIIILGVLFSAILALILWYFQYITPIPTQKLSERISIIRTGIVNCYIISKGSKRIMIDTGFSAKKVLEGLEQLKIEPNSISDIFFTHGDPDHIGGNSLFDHAQFYIGQKSKMDNPENYKFLDDNQIIEVGEIKIQAIDTPGHRLGHVVYKIDEEFLFTGDAIRLKDGLIKPFLRIISSDYGKQLKSIEKIAELDNITHLFTAHSGYTKDFEKAVSDWRKLKKKE